MVAKPIIFYDGNCALCHGCVKFILKFDRNFKFLLAPQQGEVPARYFSPEEIEAFPDSIFVRDVDGKVYLKAFAVSFILRRLGGIFKFLAKVYDLYPVRFRNLIYDIVARLRYRVFGRTEEICPLVPEEDRQRFL